MNKLIRNHNTIGKTLKNLVSSKIPQTRNISIFRGPGIDRINVKDIMRDIENAKVSKNIQQDYQKEILNNILDLETKNRNNKEEELLETYHDMRIEGDNILEELDEEIDELYNALSLSPHPYPPSDIYLTPDYEDSSDDKKGKRKGGTRKYRKKVKKSLKKKKYTKLSKKSKSKIKSLKRKK